MCTVKAEEELSLVEYGRLRRIEIFRLRIAERASAESDDATALIRDGNDDAVAEAVIDSAPALTHGGKPRVDENLLRDAALFECIGKLRPRIRRKAQLIALDRFIRNAAPREIRLARCTVARDGEAAVEKIPCERIRAPQIVQRPQARLLTRIAFSLRQGNTELLRLAFDRLERCDVLHERYEFKCIAARVAAEAVEEALGRHDGERCGLFVMEGTAAPVAVALALQGDIALHDGENVGLSAHLLHERLHPRVTHRFLLY